MTHASRLFVSTLLLAGVAATAAAQKSSLNVKPGLWEMTMKIDMPGGMPPGVDTSNIPPEQLAKMKQMMGQIAEPKVVKSCVTQEDLDKHQFQKDPENSSCKTTVTKATSTVMDITQVCTGAMAGTRESHVEAPTPTSVKMLSKGTSGRGAGMTIAMTGKWLGADCGNEK